MLHSKQQDRDISTENKMSLIKRIIEKFHSDSNNRNRMMCTVNNQQQFGMDSFGSPRNLMMDTISNEQGAAIAAMRNNSNVSYSVKVVNRNLMTHTISNQQADDLAKGIDIMEVFTVPRNKLLDLKPNEYPTGGRMKTIPAFCLNSDRVL